METFDFSLIIWSLYPPTQKKQKPVRIVVPRLFHHIIVDLRLRSRPHDHVLIYSPPFLVIVQRFSHEFTVLFFRNGRFYPRCLSSFCRRGPGGQQLLTFWSICWVISTPWFAAVLPPPGQSARTTAAPTTPPGLGHAPASPWNGSSLINPLSCSRSLHSGPCCVPRSALSLLLLAIVKLCQP